MTIETVAQTVVLAIVAAIMYAGTQFMKKEATDKPEQFDWTKFMSTVFLGGIIGIISGLKGIVPSEETIQLQLALFAGSTVIIENVIKIVVRLFRKYFLREQDAIE